MQRFRQEWLDRGSASLPDGMVDKAWWGELIAESERLAPQAVRSCDERPGIRFYRDGTMQSAQRCGSHSGGSSLRRLVQYKPLREFASEVTGSNSLVPIRYGYKYYANGDFLGVHRDNIRCTITFTFGLTDNLDGMGWLPQCRAMDNDEMRSCLRDGELFPSATDELPVEIYEIRCFDGHNIPHWRRPFENRLGVIGTICFFDL